MTACDRSFRRSFPHAASVVVGIAFLSLAAAPAAARITELIINQVESPTFGGAAFGAVGQYERLEGAAHGEVDPRDPRNAIIQDIALAPRNARGMVEYSMDVRILKPIDARRGNRTLLYDVVNRGATRAPTSINIVDPGGSGAGDGFLQSRGFTLVWSGWQGDVLPGGGRLTIKVPVARKLDGSAITGRVRTEIIPAKAGRTEPLSGFAGTAGYQPASLDNATASLTARVREQDPRLPVPNDQWAFADCSKEPFPGRPSAMHVCLKDGFDTNHIYELTYDAKDPLVLGLGFAATRDLVAFLRHGDRAAGNPLAAAVDTALLFGQSQSGRMARSLLALGFNQDEAGRVVFDGMNVHLAAGRIPLNVRFGQPTRGPALQHENRQFPADDLPVTWLPATDPVSGARSGLLDRCRATGTCPKIIQTNTDHEYWQGAMSLVTADTLQMRDLPIPDNVRVYHFASTQEAGSRPGAEPRKGICQMLSNPVSYHYNLRALLIALREWVLDGKAPPRSRYPTIAANTLVAPDPATFGFPRIPGVNFSGLHGRHTQYDRGPIFNAADLSGIADEPPRAVRHSTVLVPRVDSDGNAIDGVRSVTVQAPLGTYLGWNLRAAGFSEGDMCGNAGSFIPFAVSKKERMRTGDPRLSLEERYGTQVGYVAAVIKAAEDLVGERLMLSEDVAGVVEAARASKVFQ